MTALLALGIVSPLFFHPAELATRLNPWWQDSAAKSKPADEIVRAYWNLTFLPGNPPSKENTKSHDFTNGAHAGAADLATALNKAFGKAEGSSKSEEDKLRVTAVGTTLVIEGPRDLVQQVRRLLATQLDVSQSQILIELNTYQISSNAKAATAADQALKRFTLSQEIARVYKVAHLDAIRQVLMGAKDEILREMEARTSYGLKIPALFRRAGVDPESNRSLGQTDILLFLGYLSDKTLQACYPASLLKSFNEVHERVDSLVLAPMRSSSSDFERTLASELGALNNMLATGMERPSVGPNQQSVLRTMLKSSPTILAFANPKTDGNGENESTRDAIERFLILWLSNGDPKIVEKLKPRYPQDDQVKVAQQAFIAVSVAKQDEATEKFKALMDGDVTARLTRVASRMDDLLAIGVRALQADSEVLIDHPLERWIDRHVTMAKGSTFGVRFGGTTKLAVTSRVPGITGAESETFFPFQPTSPISLTSLLPLISRTPAPPADADQLAKAGLTPLESTILNGVFEQANKQPFDRKLGAGIHFSVLPTMLPNGSTARLQIRLSLSVDPGNTASGARKPDEGAPLDLLKSTVVETELLANAFDIALVSSLKLDISAPGKRDWAVPVLSQILPIRSWFVGPTQDKTVRHEAIVLMKVTIVPRAMDLASRSLDLP